jgi:hypothetical protein
MMINLNETRLCTIEQVEQFLSGGLQIEFSKSGDDSERYLKTAELRITSPCF